MAQSVKRPTLAQVMISRLVSSSPASGSVLTAQSLVPASDSVSFSVPPPLTLSVSKIKIKIYIHIHIYTYLKRDNSSLKNKD